LSDLRWPAGRRCRRAHGKHARAVLVELHPCITCRSPAGLKERRPPPSFTYCPLVESARRSARATLSKRSPDSVTGVGSFKPPWWAGAGCRQLVANTTVLLSPGIALTAWRMKNLSLLLSSGHYRLRRQCEHGDLIADSSVVYGRFLRRGRQPAWPRLSSSLAMRLGLSTLSMPFLGGEALSKVAVVMLPGADFDGMVGFKFDVEERPCRGDVRRLRR